MHIIFDFDGTLTSEELLPKIAKEINLYNEMKILTDATMSGLISFEGSFNLRVQLLKTIDINVINDIVKTIKIDKRLIEFIDKLQKQNHIVDIATQNLDIWVYSFIEETFRPNKIYCSLAKYDNNKLLGIEKILDKNIKSDIAIGDGANDIPLLDNSLNPIAFSSIHKPHDALIKKAKFIAYNINELKNIIETIINEE